MSTCNSGLILVGLIGLAACAQVVPDIDRKSAAGEVDFSSIEVAARESELCLSEWHGIEVEWKGRGAFANDSIAMTKLDAASGYSVAQILIRNSWAAQDTAALSSDLVEWGWPIDSDEFRRVTATVDFSGIDELSVECRQIHYFENVVSEMLLDDKGDMRPRPWEAPSNLEWDSPFASQWAIYWLLRSPNSK